MRGGTATVKGHEEGKDIIDSRIESNERKLKLDAKGSGARQQKRGGEKGERRESGRGVSRLEDINSHKRTWSLAVTPPTATIHCSLLPFFSPPPLICFIHLES